MVDVEHQLLYVIMKGLLWLVQLLTMLLSM